MKETVFNLLATNTSTILHNTVCALSFHYIRNFFGNGVRFFFFEQQQVRVDLVSFNAVNIIVISVAVVSARFGVNFSVGVEFCLLFNQFPPDQIQIIHLLCVVFRICSTEF